MLMRQLSMETASKLMGAMNTEAEEEEAPELDFKSVSEGTAKDKTLGIELFVAKEL